MLAYLLPLLRNRHDAEDVFQTVFMRAYEDMTPEVFRTVGPAPVLDAPFVRIANRKQLEDVAREFRNCLAEHGGRIAEGKMAAYVWRAEPLAAIALNRDAAGWRLSEAKAPDNVDLDERFLREVTALEGDAPERELRQFRVIGRNQVFAHGVAL